MIEKQLWLLRVGMFLWLGFLFLSCENIFMVSSPDPRDNPPSLDFSSKILLVKIDNCTVQQYLGSTVIVDRFYCEVKNNHLYIYPSFEENYIGKINSVQQTYSLNNPSSQFLTIRGQVFSENKQWIFIPQKNLFMIGPSQVQVVFD